MKLKTIRVRRNRPSALSLALALLLTMLCVYLASLPAKTEPEAEADTASAHSAATAEVRMDGMSAAFDCAGWYDSDFEARIAAANCVQNGGAGLVLQENGRWAVVEGLAAAEPAENTFTRSAPGLTLRISGSANEVSAISNCIHFLYAQATETASLAAMLASGDADADTLCSLLNIYHTQGRKIQLQMNQIQAASLVSTRLSAGLESALENLDCAIRQTDAGRLRMIHASACINWISMLMEFAAT